MDQLLNLHLPSLLLIDIQEKLFAKVLGQTALASRLEILSKACTLLQIPIVLTEQYPQGLGKTIDVLNHIPVSFEKTAFSCLGDEKIKKAIIASGCKSWIIAGIESHVCVLQTVHDLLQNNMKPVVVQDAISSRNMADHTSAIEEMRSMGARITTTETLLFELLQDAKHPQFKPISQLIR